MELDHILTEMDQADRLNRQILNPLADVAALQMPYDHFFLGDAIQRAELDRTLRVIWEREQALQESSARRLPRSKPWTRWLKSRH